MRPGNIGPGIKLVASGGAGGPAPIFPVYALESYDAINRLGSAVSQALQGAIAGFWARYLWWPTALPGAPTQGQVMCFNGAGTGYRYIVVGGTALLSPSLFMTGAASLTAPTKLIDAAKLNRLIDTVVVWDQPAGRLRHYYQGVEIGAGTASGLAYLPNAAERMVWGNRDNGTQPADRCAIAALAGGDGFVPTAGEIAAAHAATLVRVASGLPPLGAIAGKTTWLGNVGSAWDPPTTVTDTIGAQNLTMYAGSAAGLSLVSMSPPLWAA